VTLPHGDALEAAAREKVSPSTYAFYSGGSGPGRSIADNVDAWSRWYLRPRALVDVSKISTKTTVLGAEIDLPVLIAPCGFNVLAHPDAEVAVARAAAAAGTIHVLSTASSIEYDEVIKATDSPTWLQLYTDPDHGVTDARVDAARDLGFTAIAVTVDSPIAGMRDWDSFGADMLAELQRLGSRMPSVNFEATLDWDEIDRIAARSGLPVLLKGVLHPADAAEAARRGLAGVIVSNHGGRQVDGTLPPALALPDVVEAAGDDVEVYVDGGVRRGEDVLRALALGARAVLIGRPYLWALAVAGEAGVTELLGRMRLELEQAMALAGQTDATDVAGDIVVRA
jgi:4-hydroxymandelate oxidase